MQVRASWLPPCIIWFDAFLEPSHKSLRVMAAEDKSVFCEEWAKDVPADPMGCPWFCGNCSFGGQFSVLHPSLPWQQRPQHFPWLILSLSLPACSGAGDSFCGLLLCHQRGHQENKSNQALQSTRHCNSPASFLSAQGLYFVLLEHPEKLIWQRSQPRTKSCPPRQLVASPILSRWCAEDLAARRSLILFFCTPCRQSETPFDWDAPWKSFTRNDWRWCAPQADFLLSSLRLPGEHIHVSC